MCIRSDKKKKEKKKEEKTLDPWKSSEIQKGAGKASRQSSTSSTIFLSILRIYVQRTETEFKNSEQESNKDNERTETEDKRERKRETKTDSEETRERSLSCRPIKWPPLSVAQPSIQYGRHARNGALTTRVKLG